MRIRLINEKAERGYVMKRLIGDIAVIATAADMKITPDMLAVMGMTVDKLFEKALADTISESSPIFTSFVDMGVNESVGMYVLTTTEMRYGAAVILYPGVLDSVREELGDFYLLPSSVHEFIVIPAGPMVDPKDLARVVSDVNRCPDMIPAEDYLSDMVLMYDGALRPAITRAMEK